MNDYSIYVHIPFCCSKCYYCDFCSFVDNQKNIDNYFKCLKKEIINKKIKNKIKTIYFGGGTPTSVNKKYLINILKIILNNFNVDKNAEITIETNPNTLNKETLQSLYDAGFNRLSIGVQTTNKKSLEYIGRIQNKKLLKKYKNNIKNNLKIAKKIGFNNISTDLILGLPFNNDKYLKKDLKFLTKYCNHISTYMLMVEKGTKLASFDLNIDEIDENSARQYELVCKYLKHKNFEKYEISNFAKEGTYSKHNLNYWNRGNYLGFGLSAHSFVSPYRFANTNDLQKYISYYKNLTSNTRRKKEDEIVDLSKKNDIVSGEKLTAKEMAEEKIMLGLRCKLGLDLDEFKTEFFDIRKKKSNEIDLLLKQGLIYFDNNILRLTDKGFLVANQVILKLM